MNYPIVIHKDKGSDYGVTVPDLPGCFSGGSTMDEAIDMAREAIELHLEGLIEDGQLIPEACPVEVHRDDPDYRGGTWAVVAIDPANLRLKAKRVNITIPERILDAIDRFADAHNETRSRLLANAALAYIGRGGPQASDTDPSPTPRRRPKRRRAKPAGTKT